MTIIQQFAYGVFVSNGKRVPGPTSPPAPVDSAQKVAPTTSDPAASKAPAEKTAASKATASDKAAATASNDSAGATPAATSADPDTGSDSASK